MEHTFINANLEPVPYDGSEVTWRVSAYALIIKDRKLLLAKSRHEKYYDVIGGGVDIGETIEEALHREAMEEAGARIQIGKLLFTAMDWFYHRKGKFYQTLQLYYQAELVGELEQATDADIGWTGFVPIAEVGPTYTLAVSESAERLINEYLTALSKS